MITKKQITDHLVEYFLLILVLVLGYIILKFVADIFWKIILIFTMGSFYLGYGSYHHLGEKTLKLSTILEYSLISTIIIIVLLTLTR